MVSLQAGQIAGRANHSSLVRPAVAGIVVLDLKVGEGHVATRQLGVEGLKVFAVILNTDHTIKLFWLQQLKRKQFTGARLLIGEAHVDASYPLVYDTFLPILAVGMKQAICQKML